MDRAQRRMGTRRARGYTLAEVALAMLVAGLLVAAALRSGELVAQSRIKGLVADYSGTLAAYQLYVDRYSAIPGDDPGAARRWAGALAGNGDRRLSGRFDALAPRELSGFTVDALGGESLAFWWHLRLAGLASGVATGASALGQPLHAAGGIMGAEHEALGLAGLTLCLAGLQDYMAAALDAQLDDHQPGSGAMRTAREGTSTALDAYRETRDEQERYVLCGSAGGHGRSAAVAAAGP
ncbi:MAG: hypothetical protein N2544_01825 [Burkholderiales bacterium]|nr:hypothetical protein [Burkholderiales bacterium]